MKNIDPVDVKRAIKNGQLEVYVKYNLVDNNYRVYLWHKGTGDIVQLINFNEVEVKEHGCSSVKSKDKI